MEDNPPSNGNAGSSECTGAPASPPMGTSGSFCPSSKGQIQSKTISEALVTLTVSAYRAGLPHLMISTVLVQGLAYSSQLYIASLLGPRAFGVVRNTEAIISILVLLGSAGMPSLAVKSISEVTDPALRARLLGRLLQVAGLCGLVFSGIGIFTLPAFVTPETQPYFAQLVWVVGISAVGRTAINYFQGIRQVQRMAALNIMLSALSLTLLTLMVLRFGLAGWVFGRYIGESLFIGGSFFLLTGKIRLAGSLPSIYSGGRLIVLGFTIALSLVLRTLLDNAALLALAYFGRTSTEIGCYGLSSLIIAGFLLLPGATATLAIPRFVERAAKPKLGRDYYRRVIKWSLILVIPCSGLLVLLGPFLTTIFGNGYASSVLILQVLALSLPFRAAAAITGAVLMAHDRNSLTLCANLVFLVLGILLYGILVPSYGPAGAAWVTVFLESGLAVLLVCLSRRRVWCK